jgi:hypothetical protein
MGLTKPARILPPEDLVEAPEEDRYLQRAQDASLEALGITVAELKDALAQSDSAKAKEFLAAICNPKYKNYSIARLAGKYGISPHAVAELWRKSKLSKGVMKMVAGIEIVAQDIVEDAKSQFIECEKCGGTGEIDKDGDPDICPACKGKGKWRKAGDSESRKLMFEAIGYRQRGAPLVQQTFISGNHIESMVNEMEDNAIDTTASIVDTFRVDE